MANGIKTKDKLPLILALDEDLESAKKWIDRLHQEIWGFKVGSVLFTQSGPELIQMIKGLGSKVFLDLKFHDIPNTVKKSVESALSQGVDLLTVHALGGRKMLEAIAPCQTPDQRVVAVTVLTSHTDDELEELQLPASSEHVVDNLASLAIRAGVGGLVCSPLEVKAIREKFPEAVLVTPGVRLAGGDHQDQRRVATPGEALQNGASFVVLGRALTGSDNWEETWRNIKSSLAETL